MSEELEEIEGEIAAEHEMVLAVREQDALVAQAETVRNQIVSYTPEQRDLIKRTLMDDRTTDDELALFLGHCQRVGLDPIAKQVYAVRRGNRLTFQTSIDGFRLIATRTRRFGGRLGPWWCGQDEVWKDVWLSEAPPKASKVSVMHLDAVEPVTGTALWREFYPGDQQGAMWKKMPTVMLAKCAEAQALRAAFPAELSGMYIDEEMQQADRYDGPTRSPVTVKRDAPQTPPPTTWSELHRRLADALGAEETDEWMSELLKTVYDVEAARELSGDAKKVLWTKLSSVLLLVEQIEGDLQFNPDQRRLVAEAFASRFDGIALDGPAWALSPTEAEARPQKQEVLITQPSEGDK